MKDLGAVHDDTGEAPWPQIVHFVATCY